MTSDEKEYYYIFLDTNAIYSKRINYNIFNTSVLKNLIDVRNNYNQYFRETREIKLIFPEIVIKERYIQEIHKIKIELERFRSSIKHLDEPSLIKELNNVIQKVSERIIHDGDDFLVSNNIEQIPPSVEPYLQEIIKKKIENRKPFRIIEKEDKKFEKGFFDAVIWYSIVDYIKKLYFDHEPVFYNGSNENIFVIFLSNDKDFGSEELELEFFSETGIKISIIPFENTYRYDLSDQNFNKLLSKILSNSNCNSIDSIKIYYSEMSDEIDINSIYPSPLGINILSFISPPKRYSLNNFKKEFDSDLLRIIEKLKNLGFNLDDIKFEYLETKISYIFVNLRDYKSQFLDILDIELYFTDGSVMVREDIDMEISISEFEEGSILRIERSIANLLEDHGFKNIDPNIIDLDIQEYIRDSD